MEPAGYADELTQQLTLERVEEEEAQEAQFEALNEYLSGFEDDKVVIGSFLHWLELNGRSIWIIKAIRRLLKREAK